MGSINRAARVPARRRWLLLVAAGLALGLLACEDEAPTVDDGDAGTPGIDREAVLGEIDEVRDLFAGRSELDPEVIDDVSYQDTTLSITLAERGADAAAEGGEQAEQVCRDLAEAIQLPELSIVVQGPDGTLLQSCQFGP